ncbi:MAG TPA: ABC transporter substrate-binding protein [Acidimicrobiia bacterium]
MKSRRWLGLSGGVLALVLIAAACGGDEEPAALTPVRLQLQWFAQSQFAGYFAALDNGYYEDEGLDVTILEGAVDIVPQQVVATGQAEFGLAWVPKALASNEEGAGLINIGQVFQRSGTLQVAFKESGIATVEDFRGNRIGTWGFGNEHEVIAAIRKAGMDPASDITQVQQDFNMLQLLPPEAGGTGDVDAAEAMIYNEYAQVLEAINPATGELYLPEDLNVIDYNQVGTAMLQDAVWVTSDWLGEGDNADIAERFLRASFQGWVFCRDNFDACVDIVLAHGPALGRSHMIWQLNEINALIWPSPEGIGLMDQALWEQTLDVATSQGILQARPADADSFTREIAQAALDGMEGDTTGASFQKRVDIVLIEGGA